MASTQKDTSDFSNTHTGWKSKYSNKDEAGVRTQVKTGSQKKFLQGWCSNLLSSEIYHVFKLDEIIKTKWKYKILKTFRHSFVRKRFLVWHWGAQRLKLTNERESEPESLVTCSYFHCKRRQIFIPAPSLITLSCKFGLIEVLSLVKI